MRQAPRVCDVAWQASRLALGRRGPMAGERNGTGDTVSTTQGLYSGIGTCEGKVVIPQSEGEARPQAFLSCRSVYDILHIVMYNRHSSNLARTRHGGTVWVNCYHVPDTTTPSDGFKGVCGIHHTLSWLYDANLPELRALTDVNSCLARHFILHKAIIFDTHSLCRLYSATPQMLRCATVPYGSRTYRCLRDSPGGHDGLS